MMLYVIDYANSLKGCGMYINPNFVTALYPDRVDEGHWWVHLAAGGNEWVQYRVRLEDAKLIARYHGASVGELGQ